MTFHQEIDIIDFHCHILPGLDDGSDSLETSLEMARMSAQTGAHTIIATPHANQRGRFENYVSPVLQERFSRLDTWLHMENIPVRLLPGMEIFASENVVELIRQGRLCALAGTQYYLIEFPFDAPGEWLEKILYSMLYAGYLPVIAHPERYACIQQNPALIQRWREQGCWAQINKGSLLGGFGHSCKHAAIALTDADCIDLVGSDAHGVSRRSPNWTFFCEYMRTHWTKEQKRRIMQGNPSKLLENR